MFSRSSNKHVDERNRTLSAKTKAVSIPPNKTPITLTTAKHLMKLHFYFRISSAVGTFFLPKE